MIMSATGKSDSISKTSLKLLNGCWKKIELINLQIKLLLNILPMTQSVKVTQVTLTQLLKFLNHLVRTI